MDDGGAQPADGEIEAFCARELGAAETRVLWRRGRAIAVVLGDGRRVVVHALPDACGLPRALAIVRVQMHLASRGLFAPTVCGGPAPLGRGLAIVEALIERGVERDGRDPIVLAARARALAAIVAAGRSLDGAGLPLVGDDGGELVIGHAALAAGKLRFDGDRVVAVFGWSALCRAREPALLERLLAGASAEDARAFRIEYERRR